MKTTRHSQEANLLLELNNSETGNANKPDRVLAAALFQYEPLG